MKNISVGLQSKKNEEGWKSKGGEKNRRGENKKLGLNKSNINTNRILEKIHAGAHLTAQIIIAMMREVAISRKRTNSTVRMSLKAWNEL